MENNKHPFGLSNKELQKLGHSFWAWLVKRNRAEDHGCLRGDCPHYKKSECYDALRQDYETEKGVSPWRKKPQKTKRKN